MHPQFKPTFSRKIQQIEIKRKYIAKCTKNVPKFEHVDHGTVGMLHDKTGGQNKKK